MNWFFESLTGQDKFGDAPRLGKIISHDYIIGEPGRGGAVQQAV